MHFFLSYTPFYVGEEFVLWGKPIREKFIILCQYIYPCSHLIVQSTQPTQLQNIQPLLLNKYGY